MPHIFLEVEILIHKVYTGISGGKMTQSVGRLAMGWITEGSEFENVLFSKYFRPAMVHTEPPAHWVRGVHSSGVKRPVREADHSPPTSAEVK
jgi:hypothetical protein